MDAWKLSIAGVGRYFQMEDQPSNERSIMAVLILCGAAVLALLCAGTILFVPRTINRSGAAKAAKAMSDIESLRHAVLQFRLDCDRYPTTAEGLDALTKKPTGVTGWRGPYLAGPAPLDPWTSPYEYRSPGAKGPDSFVIVSYGSDSKPGGVGDAADLDSDRVP